MIDVVLPYVNCLDPQWKDLYSKYRINPNKEDLKRFDDYDYLKFCLRGISKNLPFINKLHFIVMQESQIPKWINRDNIHIVYHKDFIPEKYLPCFNSATMERFLHKIPELSDNFIYGNDDVIAIRNIDRKCFFIDLDDKMIPVISYVSYTRRYDFYSRAIPYLEKEFGLKYKDVYRNGVKHSFNAFNKNDIIDFYNKYEDLVTSGICRFRCNKPKKDYFSQELWKILMAFKYTKYKSSFKYTYRVISDIHEEINQKNINKCDCINLNNGYKNLEEFNIGLTEKCKYEI
jgi:hypothetical protein